MPKYPGVRKKRERWYYRLQYKGKRIEKGSFLSAESAHRARLTHLKELQRHQVAPLNFTVEQLIIKYIDEHEKVYNRAPTAIKNEGICRNQIIPLIGRRRIADLKPSNMRQFQNQLVQHKTPSVSYNTMRTIKKIFNWAVEWEIMGDNPIKGKLPPEPRAEHPTLSIEQLALIFSKAAAREKVAIALGVFAGMRIGEIFGLRWEDIDFKENTIYIRRQFTSGLIGPVKTEGSKSIIPIWDQLANMLKAWKLQCGSPDWVFGGKLPYRPLRPERWRQLQWTKIKNQFHLPSDLRFHDLRHSFATILLSQGADKGDIQQLMRHKSIKITMDINRHLLPKDVTRAYEFFNKLCGEQSGERDLLSL